MAITRCRRTGRWPALPSTLGEFIWEKRTRRSWAIQPIDASGCLCGVKRIDLVLAFVTARDAQFFAERAGKQARDYSSTGAAGTSVPMTGVLVRACLGLMNSSKAFSNPGYDSRMHSAT